MPSSKSIKTLAWGVSALGIGQSALLVYLPWLVELTPADYADWAQLFGAGMGCYLIGSIAWPLLLMRLGHRTVLYAGLIGFGLSMILLGCVCWAWQLQLISESQCLSGLLISRLTYGLFVSALMPATQSWCAEISTPSQRLAAFSAISLQFSLGRTLGPVITVISQYLHPLAPLWMMGLWPMIIIGLIHKVPSVAVTPHPEKGLMALLKNMRPPAGLGLIALTTTAIASTLQFQASPALGHILQLPPADISQALAILVTIGALFSAIAHRLQLRYPPPHIRWRIHGLCALLLVSVLGLGLAISTADIWVYSGIMIVIGVALSWLTPLYSTQLSLQSSQQAIAATQLSILHILGHWLGLSVTGYLIGISLVSLSFWMAALVAVMFIATFLVTFDAGQTDTQ